jgi:hypothetical protein
MPRSRTILLRLAAAAWLAGWGWLLGPAFSSSFFQYHQFSRISVWLANLAAVALTTAALARTWQAEVQESPGSTRRVLVRQIAVTTAGWIGAWAVVWLATRLPAGYRLSADDSMGAGIDLLMTLTWGSLAILAGGLKLVWDRRVNAERRVPNAK